MEKLDVLLPFPLLLVLPLTRCAPLGIEPITSDFKDEHLDGRSDKIWFTRKRKVITYRLSHRRTLNDVLGEIMYAGGDISEIS
ncbi:hypothetical protein ACTXT7_012139 [Hymenolepis weldensis]